MPDRCDLGVTWGVKLGVTQSVRLDGNLSVMPGVTLAVKCRCADSEGQV